MAWRDPTAPSPYMSVANYLQILRRSLPLILTLVLLGGGGLWFYAQTLPKQYRSVAAVLVIPEQGTTTGELMQGTNVVQNTVASYAYLASTPFVLQPAIDRTQLDVTPGQLARRVTVETPLNTAVIEIVVVDQSPQDAQRITDAIATSLVEAVEKVAPRVGEEVAVRLVTISPATLPQSFVSPNARLYALVGAALGLALGLGIAFMREHLRSRPQTSDELRAHSDLPVLGEVPVSSRSVPLATRILESPGGVFAEAFRAVIASLRFVAVDRPARVIIVTSAEPGDGKTSVAAGLGLMLAETGKRTLVIDADLREPTMARALELDPDVGLTTLLVDEMPLEEVAQRWGHPNLRVLVAGPPTPNPGNLITSGRLNDIIQRARSEYDSVVIDSPPVLSVSDARWLAPLTDGVVIVARARKTRMRAIRSAIEAIRSSRAVVLGLVLNGVRTTVIGYGLAYGEERKPRRAAKASGNG